MTALVEIPPTFRSRDADEEGEAWIAYIRVSTWKEEKISPELQREAISLWARQTGRRIIDWVQDLDVSGRHFKRKIMKCIERVESGEARGVAVWRYSRFGRDRTGTTVNLARLQAVGGELESATEPVDATTAIGRFQRGMILEFNAFESDRAGEQWKETHDHRKYKLGLPAQGRKRYGYVWHRRYNPITEKLQKERYEPHSVQGPIVAGLYREYTLGTGFTKLAVVLNNTGERTTQRSLWTAETLQRYMDSGFAAGLLHVHDPECKCGKKNGKCRNKVYIQGAHEELVDFDLWRAYLRRREEIKASVPRSREGIYELTGLVRCTACRGGTSLNAQRVKGVNVAGAMYRCTQRAKSGALACSGILVSRVWVEKEVRKWLRDKVAEGVDKAPATVDPSEPTTADVTAATLRARTMAQAEVDRQRSALARLRAEHAADPDSWEPGEYEEAVEVIRGKRAEAQTILNSIPEEPSAQAREDVAPLVVGLVAEWESLRVAERNALLRQVIRRVAITRDPSGARAELGAGVGTANHTVTVHAVWDPDPWPARKKMEEVTADA
ncbi:recombinase family protein [Streptomyces sp. CH6]|uniref:recombinase family protein n=1 Tax=unclassified Streptomyces TaxID=2593676 RepID=UPI003D0860ED